MASDDRRDGTDDGAFDWEAYVDFVVDREGSLTAAAERLAAARGYSDDVASVERALRRLRRRGNRGGGLWGARALATFGVPGDVLGRLAWMAAYHSRFTDLPVPVAADLVRAWDRPPLDGTRAARAWLALAHASIALRRARLEEATARIEAAKADLAGAEADARVEALLVRAYVASRQAPEAVDALLTEAEGRMPSVGDPEAAACLRARIADHRGYASTKRGDFAHAEALYRALPADDTIPFVAARRASGLAHALWKQGASDEAEALARRAIDHAGDGGHVRLRAMALALLARIAKGATAVEAHARAVAISKRLDDETLRLRLARRPPRPEGGTPTRSL